MPRSKAEPTVSTLKTLFGLSGNLCAFRDPESNSACEANMVRASWESVNGVACHIRGALPTSARYDDTMTDDERRHFDNLILLCPSHHNQIDNLEPERFTVEALIKMKNDALLNPAPWDHWATDEALDEAVREIRSTTQYMVTYGYLQPAQTDEPAASDVQGSAEVPLGAVTTSAVGVAHVVTRAASDESRNDDVAHVTRPPTTDSPSSDRLSDNAGRTVLRDISNSVLDMRQLFNTQHVEHANDATPWVPAYESPETLARTNLMRRLEVSLAMLGSDAADLPNTKTLTTTHLWSSSLLEQAFDEVKNALRPD